MARDFIRTPLSQYPVGFKFPLGDVFQGYISQGYFSKQKKKTRARKLNLFFGE